MKLSLLCILFLMSVTTAAQSSRTSIGARMNGMGNSGLLLEDEHALFNNVGAMAHTSEPSLFFSYESQPSLPGADRRVAGIVWPMKIGVGGIGFFRFGDDLYSEQVIHTAFSNKFGSTSLGLNINLIQYRTQGFPEISVASISFGGLTQITPQISVGASIININQPLIGTNEYLPTRLLAGIGIRPTKYFLFVTEVEKDIAYIATWRCGAEYELHKQVKLRTGFNVNPSCGTFGLGLQSKRIKIDYAISISQVFSTHQLSVGSHLGKKVVK